MTTKEQLIDNIIEWLKDYEDDTGVIEIWSNQLRLLLKEYIQEPTLTYEQWFERWKQVGYKEWCWEYKDTTIYFYDDKKMLCEDCRKDNEDSGRCRKCWLRYEFCKCNLIYWE